jgi:hypothetical protein
MADITHDRTVASLRAMAQLLDSGIFGTWFKKSMFFP